MAVPSGIPTLLDAESGVTLRAYRDADLPAIVEQARDPQTKRWTTVPVPEGYGLAEAGAYVEATRDGWRTGRSCGWAVSAPLEGRPRFAGTIGLRMGDHGAGEISFGAHPAVRGLSVMSTALRLVRDYGFGVGELHVLRWRGMVGDWSSRRVTAAAGFRFDGTIRRFVVQRGRLHDGWVATITSQDPRISLDWADPPRLRGRLVMLRPFEERDAQRVTEACRDERTRHWLVSLPSPYRLADAYGYIEAGREDAARGQGWTWCVADVVEDRCVGSVGLGGFGGYARRSEIGYWAHPDARGRGATTEAVRLVTEHAESHSLVDSIVIRCAVENHASRRVAEAAGYALVGTLPAAEPLGDQALSDLVIYSRP